MSTAALPARAASGLRVRASLHRNRRWALLTSYVFLVIFAIFFMIPPYYMVVTALKSDAEVAHMTTNPWIIADGLTLDQFRILFKQTDFLIYFKNTVIVTLCVVAITMVVSVLAAFSLGRMKFWGSSILTTGIFLTYLVPDTLLFIPLFQIVKAVGLLNSYWGMALVYPTLTVPFCTWIMIGYFQSIPKELDEAALIDGAAQGSRHRHRVSELRTLPHMTAFENMSFGLKLRKFPKDEIRRRVDNAARILDITELLDRKPKALSGGQRQRVAMGRAIVRNPKVLLFDESLSNLDAKLRVQMRTEIKCVHQMVKTTTVYVTHDQVEAMTLADRVVVMNGGLIEQIATPQDLYRHPKTRFVAGFIGSPAMNFFRCRVEQNGAGLRVRVSDAISLPVPASQWARYQSTAGKDLTLGLRPEHITEPRRSERAIPIANFPRPSTSLSRWAWRRWCISPSTARRFADGSIPGPRPARAKPCGFTPAWTTCT